jgi:hypothetical protein
MLVAARHRDDFVEHIACIVFTACLRSRRSERTDLDAPFLAAAKAVRAAHGAVAKLTPQQKGQLGVALTASRSDGRCLWMLSGLRFDVQDNLVLTLIDGLDAAFGELIGRSPHAPPSTRGKPSGAKAQWAMHEFAVRLWDSARFYGNVTLSNLDGQPKGTIVTLLGILEPMLPKKFFPGILDYSFLRKVQKSLPPNPALRELKRLGGWPSKDA